MLGGMLEGFQQGIGLPEREHVMRVPGINSCKEPGKVPDTQQALRKC
jgi:hypothetical protein